MGYRPNSEQVGVAWLKGITELGNAVATEVPTDVSTWAASGFTKVTSIGGDPNYYLPLARPNLSLHFFAAAVNSSRPPWGVAFRLAEAVRMETHSASAQRRLTGMSGANNAKVLNARLEEPRRLEGDPGGAAEVVCDLALDWVEVP
jgi:hypothetical protein